MAHDDDHRGRVRRPPHGRRRHRPAGRLPAQQPAHRLLRSRRPTPQGRPVANRVQPGKRPRSSMSPTLVFDARDGRLLMTLGLARRRGHHPLHAPRRCSARCTGAWMRSAPSTCPTSAASTGPRCWRRDASRGHGRGAARARATSSIGDRTDQRPAGHPAQRPTAGSAAPTRGARAWCAATECGRRGRATTISASRQCPRGLVHQRRAAVDQPGVDLHQVGAGLDLGRARRRRSSRRPRR
ncbi:MAG: gamma-glutamyltransferase [Comamonadaceae bacterium]|nr:gamma-glutamyltransferase [Comamonadaceae bacterium]